MIKIIPKKGNLLDVKHGWIVHGCNSHGIMGSGVAKAIKETYPLVYETYRKEYEEYGLALGTNVYCLVNEPLIIVNAITQKDMGADGKRYVSYDAIQTCFEDLNKNIGIVNTVRDEIHIPLIGAGLGGGSWPIIREIIEQTVDYPTTLWILQ